MKIAHAPLAEFISPDQDFAGAPLLRGQFALSDAHGTVVAARLTVSALGVVEPWLNGERATQDLLTPGWSAYDKRLRYAQYDVTELVRDINVIGLALGNGWYRGRLTWLDLRSVYGAELAGYAEMLVQFEDGFEQRYATDNTWRAGASSTTANDIYDGQDIDARLEDRAWLEPDAALHDWVGVHLSTSFHGTLEPYIGPPVRAQEALAPVNVWLSPAGKTLVDFGQNITGWVRTTVRGAAGDIIRIRHAEVLENGELCTGPLRSARATDRLTLSGDVDRFEPTFTFHGFRYIEIEGWPGGVDALSEHGGVEAVVVSSELRRIGRLTTSDPLLNRLHENAVWGMRGNFLDVPTDCPQRDERLGWTGDIAVFAPSAAFLFDVDSFLRDWLRDLAAEQDAANGVVPMVVPDPIKFAPTPDLPTPDVTAIWGDAAVWVPWALWTAYGDAAVLRAQWSSMRAHADLVDERVRLSPRGVWDSGFQFGDWLDPDASPDRPADAKADPHVVATLCAFRTARIMVDAAGVLEDPAAVLQYEAMAERIRAGFLREYVDGGLIASDCTTVYSLALVFEILAEPERRVAGNRLGELVIESGFRISTGFAGTPFILDALCIAGRSDLALQLLLEKECPSWLYPVTMGATTVWERWDSMLPDGRVNPGEMTSFNHYALGAVVDWMHRYIGGIAPLEPGYAKVLIEPLAFDVLNSAQCELDSASGPISVRWTRTGPRVDVVVSVPEGVRGLLRLPGADTEWVEAGEHHRTTSVAALVPSGRTAGAGH